MQKINQAVVAISTALLSGCATAPGGTGIGEQFRQTFASKDPCSNNARNIGIASGVILGALIGNSAGNRKSEAMLGGALIGGLVGGVIGSDMDRKRCELSKIAKTYDLDMTFTEVTVDGGAKDVSAANDQNTSPPPTKQVVGSALTLRDKDGVSGHFDSGSDRLTPRAQEYFSAIAAQYSGEAQLATQSDDGQRENWRKQLLQRRLFLVGHTDDAGSSQVNADLSERRARAVAAFLKKHGVPEDVLFYQGAGETLPVADNLTEAGRSMNRRVEIVEMVDEASFKKYLEIRKPRYEYYRPKEQAPSERQASIPQSEERALERRAAGLPQRRTVSPKTDVSTLARAPGSVAEDSSIDFGGEPFRSHQAEVDIGKMVATKSSLSLISPAHADQPLMGSCAQDRPRISRGVKSLRGDKEPSFATADYLPGVYNSAWHASVNGHLVALTKVAVLRDGGAPARKPTVLIYRDYKGDSSAKPNLRYEPEVNTYQGEKALLYRVFVDGAVSCMDIVIPNMNPREAIGSALIYPRHGQLYRAAFSPRLAR